MNITWNADKYTNDFSFVHQYGSGVAELLDCRAGSAVLDLGCGNGALTGLLRDKGVAVTGIDASEDLLNVARKNYPDIRFIHADATCFALEKPVDAVFPMLFFTGSMKTDSR